MAKSTKAEVNRRVHSCEADLRRESKQLRHTFLRGRVGVQKRQAETYLAKARGRQS